MSRSALECAHSSSGHTYAPDSLTHCFICTVCGTCERRNGQYWWAGKWSKNEPPCGNNSVEQRQWYASANADPDPNGLFT